MAAWPVPLQFVMDKGHNSSEVTEHWHYGNIVEYALMDRWGILAGAKARTMSTVRGQ